MVDSTCFILPRGASPEGGTGGTSSPPPEIRKNSKDENQPTPQPAMRIDSRKKFKFSLNFYLNFLKNFQNNF